MTLLRLIARQPRGAAAEVRHVRGFGAEPTSPPTWCY